MQAESSFASASAMVRDVINARNSPDYLAQLEMQLLKATPASQSMGQVGQKPDQETFIASLVKLLVNPSMVVAGALCDSLVSSSPEYESVCNSLMIIFRHNRQDLRLVEWAVEKEIESCEVGKTATLFRGMTVGAKLASIFLHMKGHFFLKGVLQPLIAHMQNASSIEVDPLKMADLSLLPENQKRLTDSVEQMFRVMESAIDIFPSALKLVFQTAQRKVEQRFHEKGYELIGGFFFLRFVCPALVSPERVGLASGVLSTETRRSLILISKVLQNASNDVQFGDKEKYMLFINEWIVNNQERMQRFLSQLCLVPPDVDVNAATLIKERTATEEERKMAMRAVVSSFITHKEQMCAALNGHKEQSLFVRLVQAIDPSELSVENVTLNFRDAVLGISLSEVDVKRSPDSYLTSQARKKEKEKKEKKDKQKKTGGEAKEGSKIDGKVGQTNAGGGAAKEKEDGKVMLKGRWRRLNRPASPPSDAPPPPSPRSSSGGFAQLSAVLGFGTASSPPESFLRMSKELVHQELRTNFIEGKAALRHVAANDEMQHALESQASVLKEQLAAEREVRRKVETELKIARNQLGQEAARREVLERLVQAMQDKFRVAGINFSLPTGICLPSTASQHADNGSTKSVFTVPTPIRPSPGLLISTNTGKISANASSGGVTRFNHGVSSIHSASSIASSPASSPSYFRPVPSPQNSKMLGMGLGQPFANALMSPTLQRSPSPGSAPGSSTAARVALLPPSSPGLMTRPGRSGTSLIASAYQNSGRPIPQADEAKSLTERLVEKMCSSEQGLRLSEREGKRCFSGAECVDWLVEELRVGRDKALMIGDKLLMRGFFRARSDNTTCFTDDNAAYYVVERAEGGGMLDSSDG